MGNDQPALRALVCLRIGPLRTGNLLDLAKEARQMAKFAQCCLHKQLQSVLIFSVIFI
jgi:hypothetical protein